MAPYDSCTIEAPQNTILVLLQCQVVFLFCQALLNGDPPDEAMEVDKPEETAVDLCHNTVAIEKILAFGRDLQALFTKLTASKPNEQLHTLLQV